MLSNGGEGENINDGNNNNDAMLCWNCCSRTLNTTL